MKIAHGKTLETAMAALQSAQSALFELQTQFAVSDECEVATILARQKMGKIDVALSAELQRLDRVSANY